MTYGEPFDIIVIGGGIVGLTAAIAMRQRHFNVLIIDKNAFQPTTQTTKRVYALNHASIHLLHTLGVWQRCEEMDRSPYRQMHIWDTTNHATLDFDARLQGKSELGFIIEENSLKTALLKQGQEEGVVYQPETEALTLTEKEQCITVKTSRETLSASLVIITDGAQSALHATLNIKITTWPYHQHALIATVNTEKSHQATAYQVFTAEGPLAFLPLKNPYECSIVWSSQKATSLATLDEDTFNQTLTTTFENTLGPCKLMSARHLFPLHMRHTQQYHGQRWILMGDAAHTIHPLAGLGLNLGLADLTTWLMLCDQNPKKPFTPKTLGAYQRARKHAAWQIIVLLEALKMIFVNSLTPLSFIRGIGLDVINQLPTLKRLLINYAAGE
jgi:2-octaprenylphenol hydroxylase